MEHVEERLHVLYRNVAKEVSKKAEVLHCSISLCYSNLAVSCHTCMDMTDACQFPDRRKYSLDGQIRSKVDAIYDVQSLCVGAKIREKNVI